MVICQTARVERQGLGQGPDLGGRPQRRGDIFRKACSDKVLPQSDYRQPTVSGRSSEPAAAAKRRIGLPLAVC